MQATLIRVPGRAAGHTHKAKDGVPGRVQATLIRVPGRLQATLIRPEVGSQGGLQATLIRPEVASKRTPSR